MFIMSLKSLSLPLCIAARWMQLRPLSAVLADASGKKYIAQQLLTILVQALTNSEGVCSEEDSSQFTITSFHCIMKWGIPFVVWNI